MFEMIIVLYSFTNLGDKSHAAALFSHLSCPHYMAIDASDLSRALSEYDACKNQLSKNTMLLAVGEQGLEALCKLNDERRLDNLSAKIGLSIHQYFTKIQELQFTLDFIAIPEIGLDENAQKVLYSIDDRVFTLAVPTHNPLPQELHRAYNSAFLAPDLENRQFKNESCGANEDEGKPTLSHSYIIVTLPGDAVDTEGKIRYFTQESAEKLFASIVALREAHGNKHTIIVQNSPRTGKFNQQTGALECTHEYQAGTDPKNAIDKISHFFIDLLDKNNIPYHFYNFAFELQNDARNKKSVYEPLLYLAMSNPNNYFIVPGESVTMLGQVPVYLRAKQAIIFEPSSMNDMHKMIANKMKFNSEKGRGYLAHFEERDGKIAIYRPFPEATEPMQDDATLVANGIKALATSRYKQILASLNMLGQWAEVLGAGLIYEATRREYLTPVQALTACVPLVGVYMYRRHMSAVAVKPTNTTSTAHSVRENEVSSTSSMSPSTSK